MAADLDPLQQQILDLQSQVAFQEDAIRSLDAALAQQQQQLLLLRRQVELLSARQQAQGAQEAVTAADSRLDEKPPHY